MTDKHGERGLQEFFRRHDEQDQRHAGTTVAATKSMRYANGEGFCTAGLRFSTFIFCPPKAQGNLDAHDGVAYVRQGLDCAISIIETRNTQ